jgi:two-component system phosphate regulon sensor histidine kinase PhoR
MARGRPSARQGLTLLNTIFLRRLLLPLVGVLFAALTLVAIVALIELLPESPSDATHRRFLIVLSVSALALILAIGWAMWIVWRYRRSEGQLIGDALKRALSRSDSIPSPPENPPLFPQVVDDVFASFQKVMTQASQDKAQLLTIISSMSEGLIAIDNQQRILLVNRAAIQLMNLKLEALEGRQLWEVMPLDEVLKGVSDVLLTGQNNKFRIGPIDGRHLEITICRLPAMQGGVTILAYDITEATQYQELRKEFVANVSHELRTPLTVIKGFIETLVDGAIDDKTRARQYLQTVGRHTEQLTNLVTDLLDLSRLDAAQKLAKREPVDVNAAAKKVAELMLPAAQKKRQALHLDLTEPLASIMGDADYLHRALFNLIDNAVKYTREGGEIRLSTAASDGTITIEVSDNGIGIPLEDQPRIFERFYRVDRSRSREMGGTGLGLSIVKHVIQSHGGTIDVDSVLGEGSRFIMRLPISTPATSS